MGYFLNRKKDIKDGKYSQVLANGLDNKLREDLERLKKIRAHRGLRHYWGLRVRGQHTKTTGRRRRTALGKGSCRLASIPSSISRSAPFFSPLSFFVMNRLVSLFRSED